MSQFLASTYQMLTIGINFIHHSIDFYSSVKVRKTNDTQMKELDGSRKEIFLILIHIFFDIDDEVEDEEEIKMKHLSETTPGEFYSWTVVNNFMKISSFQLRNIFSSLSKIDLNWI